MRPQLTGTLIALVFALPAGWSCTTPPSREPEGALEGMHNSLRPIGDDFASLTRFYNEHGEWPASPEALKAYIDATETELPAGKVPFGQYSFHSHDGILIMLPLRSHRPRRWADGVAFEYRDGVLQFVPIPEGVRVR